jgi:hypothetical protein
MNPNADRNEIAVLPALESALVGAAAIRLSGPKRRRWVLPAALASALVVGGVAVAATGVFSGDVIDSGETAGQGPSSGPFGVRIAPQHADPAHPICLQLQFKNSRPAFGCGSSPSVAEPFGVVIADGSPERVIYGLVTEEIATVSSIGDDGAELTAATQLRANLPGRYFSLIVPADSQIELIGRDPSGAEVARIGSQEPPATPPLSREEAVAVGDPAGFAPTVVPVRRIIYRGEPIDPSEVQRRALACVEGRSEVTCYDSVAEAEQQGSAAPKQSN